MIPASFIERQLLLGVRERRSSRVAVRTGRVAVDDDAMVRIRRARLKAGLTEVEFGRSIGLSPASIRGLLHGSSTTVDLGVAEALRVNWSIEI